MNELRITDEEREFLLLAELPEPDDVSVAEATAESAPAPEDLKLTSSLLNYQQEFALRLASEITQWLATDVDVEVTNSTRPTYGEFVFGLLHPTCFAIVKCEPLESPIVMELHPELIYPLLDRLMGGGTLPVATNQRTMTEFEKRVVGRLIERVLECFSAAWPIELDLKLQQIESNPKLARCAHPVDVMYATELKVTCGTIRGLVRIAIADKSLQPFREELLNPPVPEVPEPQELSLSVCVATTTLEREQLMDLRVGDILVTDTPSSEPVTIFIDDQAELVGQAVSLNGTKAVRILSAD